MAKQSGLGDNFYVAGYDLSGDIGSLSSIHGGNTPIEVTGISSSAIERLGGRRDGSISFNAWMNDSVGNGAHTRLKTLPTADVVCTYFRGAALGNAAASVTAKQVNYDASRDAAGSLSWSVDAQANGFGLEWGIQLTPGIKTDTTATNGTGVDTTASLSFGAQAYLQVFALTGTSVTVKIQDSADNASFADVTSLAFTAATVPGAQRIAISNTATVRRYVRAISTGTFTAANFAVMLVKNEEAGKVF